MVNIMTPCVQWSTEQTHTMACSLCLPEFLSSNLMNATLPLETIFSLPDHAGSSSFQSAALENMKVDCDCHSHNRCIASP